jgi:hypothetical protein
LRFLPPHAIGHGGAFIQEPVHERDPIGRAGHRNKTGQRQGTLKSAREQAMEALESNHHEAIAAENGYELDNDTQPAPAAKPAPSSGEQQLAAQFSDAPAETGNSAPPTNVKIKIDGEGASSHPNAVSTDESHVSQAVMQSLRCDFFDMKVAQYHQPTDGLIAPMPTTD